MIKNILIQNTITNLIITPPAENIAITGIIFCNRNLINSDLLTVYLANSLEIEGDNTIIINNKEMLPGETFILSDIEKFLLEEGDFISALSSNGNITATISYMNI